MLKVRIIPVLTFNGFALVKTKRFSNPRMVGNAVQAARVFNSRGVDELAFIDIFASKQNRKLNLEIVKDIIKECYMPVAIGGGINTLDDINDLLKIGADKVIIKSKTLTDSLFIKEAAYVYGSQCLTVSVDAHKVNDNYKIYNNLGLDIDLLTFIKANESNGAGEFLVNSVDNDGMMTGFDTDLINLVENNSSVPIIAVGGGGHVNDYLKLFQNTNIEAVGSSSIFHFTQYTPNDIKKALHNIGKPVRILN